MNMPCPETWRLCTRSAADRAAENCGTIAQWEDLIFQPVVLLTQNVALKPSARRFVSSFGLRKDQLAARRLILLSASAVNFFSVAFSSSRVFCRTLAQSLRPSSFAHAIRLP
jgi:hypothetical protein